MFVIGAILVDRHLQSVANYLILSLAVADLLVAILVMPLGAIAEVMSLYIQHTNFFKLVLLTLNTPFIDK